MAGETISATPSHPFWVEDTGWVDADELEAGMEVSLASGERATIVSVVREHLASPVDVYNFEVTDFHTYFVASAGVWVHNSCTAKVVGDHAGMHRYHANKQLYSELVDGTLDIGKLKRKYGTDAVDRFIAGRGKRNLAGADWHHLTEDTMKLAKRSAHQRYHRIPGKKNGVYARMVEEGKWRPRR